MNEFVWFWFVNVRSHDVGNFQTLLWAHDDSFILPQMISAVRATSCLPYASSDVGSGRCRMSKMALQKLSITRMGSVLTLQLSVQEKHVTVICTAWLDNSGYLDDSTICVDDTVVLGGSSDCLSWVEAECKLIRMDVPTLLTSIHVNSLNCTAKNADLLGLPVGPNCRINIMNSVRPISIIVSRTSANGCGVVSSHCLLIKSTSPVEAKSNFQPHNQEQNDNYSSISVVKEIAHRTVLPYVVTCSNYNDLRNQSMSLLRGLLLVGPPGVGKTYAVKAVQSLCAHVCKVRIYEISIPNLLSESDPVKVLDEQFATIAALRRTPVSPTVGTSSSTALSPGTPTKSSLFSSTVSTPATVSSSSSVAFSARNNTFAYRSPAAMAASATAAATPSTSRKASAPEPSTPVGKTPSASATTAKKSLIGGRTPPPASFKDMLNASRAGKSKSTETPSKQAGTDGLEAAAHGRGEEKCEQEIVQYLPEMAFIVIDEIDALGNSGQQNESQISIKQYLCRWLDRQGCTAPRADSLYTCLVGTSNRSGDIDPSLRRGGRFEHEIAVLNSQEDRCCLLESLLAKAFGETERILSEVPKGKWLSIENVSLLADKIAMQTGGYVAADLTALVRTMHTLTLEKEYRGTLTVNEMLKLFHIAAKSVQPSCLRGATIALPNLTFDDVIGYEEVKNSLQRVLCFAKPEQQALSSRFGLHSSPGGVLLHGPPGNSKTRLASAAAAHHGLPMISLSAADIYSPYVGDAEAEVRRAFQLARQAAPCVLFIDELDSIVTNRSNDSGGAGSTSASVEGRVLATLLTEMDGIQNSNDSEFSNNSGGKGSNSSGGVIVLGATNRLDFIDAALLRKGRFHHVLLVPLPDEKERILLLNYFVKKCGLLSPGAAEAGEDLAQRLREGMSGAEIENMCREATLERHRSLMQ